MSAQLVEHGSGIAEVMGSSLILTTALGVFITAKIVFVFINSHIQHTVMHIMMIYFSLGIPA